MGITWSEAEMAAWTELFGGREWMHHAPCGAKSKKNKKKIIHSYIILIFKIYVYTIRRLKAENKVLHKN